MKAAVLIACMSATAAADPPIDVDVGIGARITWGPGTYFEGHDGSPHPSLFATATTPFTPHLAIGARVAAAREVYDTIGTDCYTLYSFDLGVALAYRDPRFSLTAWLGRHASRLGGTGGTGCPMVTTEWNDDFTSFGASAAIDIADHVAVFLDVQSATGGTSLLSAPHYSFNYTAITTGVAYRR